MFKSRTKFLALMACFSVLLLCGTLAFCLETQNFGSNVNITYTAPKGFLTYSLNSAQNGWVVTGYDESKRQGKTTIEIPETFSQDGKTLPVTEIKANAFKSNAVFTSLVLNKNMLIIGTDAFSSSKITEVYYPGSLKEWCESSITGLKYLLTYNTDLYINDTKIAGQLTITNDITRINDRAFYQIDEVTNISIGSGVNSIGNFAFYSTKDNINTISIDKNNANYTSRTANNATECNVIIDKTTKTLIQGCKNSTIPNDNSVTKIGDYAFYYCGLSGTLALPSGLTAIGNYSFGYCTKLTGKLAISNTVIDVGESAFSNCSGLTGLTLGSSVERIRSSAFSDCINLTGSLILPTSLTYIESYAFYNCSGLTGSITLSANVKKIGYCALSTTGISQIRYAGTLKQWCEQITFGQYAVFLYSDSATSRELYINGSKISNLTITSDITKISDYAFDSYKGLTSLTLGSNLKTIGWYAFSYCSGLTGPLTIPNSVTEIGHDAFGNCSGLTRVILGTGLTNLSDYLFNSSGLTTITIPKTITSIGNAAFLNCDSLMESFIESPEVYKLLGRWLTDGYLTFNTGSKTYVLASIDDGTNTRLTNTRDFTKSTATIDGKNYNVYTKIR